MDGQTRGDRTLDALESVAAEVEMLRTLREHEMGVEIENVEGDLHVRPVERD